MSKEVKLDEMLKFTKEINESQGVISKDVFQAVKNSTKDNTQYDRSITKIEQDRKLVEISIWVKRIGSRRHIGKVKS